jgi:hypothetical protein
MMLELQFAMNMVMKRGYSLGSDLQSPISIAFFFHSLHMDITLCRMVYGVFFASKDCISSVGKREQCLS